MNKLTERQKYIAALSGTKAYWLQHYIGNIYETKNEIEQIKISAKGKSWFMGEYVGMYVAYSPDGKRKYFEYFMQDSQTREATYRWKKLAKKAAKLFAKGDAKQAQQIIKQIDTESNDECWYHIK